MKYVDPLNYCAFPSSLPCQPDRTYVAKVSVPEEGGWTAFMIQVRQRKVLLVQRRKIVHNMLKNCYEVLHSSKRYTFNDYIIFVILSSVDKSVTILPPF